MRVRVRMRVPVPVPVPVHIDAADYLLHPCAVLSYPVTSDLNAIFPMMVTKRMRTC